MSFCVYAHSSGLEFEVAKFKIQGQGCGNTSFSRYTVYKKLIIITPCTFAYVRSLRYCKIL